MKVKLKETGKIITGNTPKTSEAENYSSNDIPFIKPSDIHENDILKISESEYWISEYARKKARILPPNSVLVTCIGIIGKVAINTGECAFNQQINAIIPDSERYLPEYIAYAILSKQKYLQEIANAPVVPIINKSQFADIDIQTIDIQAQKRVVDKLSRVSELIKLNNCRLNKLDELIKSRFVEMFGDPIINPYNWDELLIANVLRGKASNGFFAKRDEYCDNGNVSILGVTNIVNRMYSNCDNLPKTNANNTSIEKYRVQYGDMLFCRSSLVAEGIGKASIVPANIPDNVLFECHVIRLPLDTNKVIPEFLQVLTSIDYFRNQVLASAKTATMTTIGQDGILKCNIILPPYKMQQEYLASISRIEKTKSAVNQSIEKLETLKKSLMQEYFG